jgi:type IV pilus assembly protein PilB
VGEIRDEETAEIALRAAQTGHLVLATIHCDSNATALIRLLDLGVSSILMSTGLNLVLSQRLMRRLCKACRKPAEISPITARKLLRLGLDPSQIFEPVGCELCGDTGYFGRIAICDILHVTQELRAEIAHDEGIVTKLREEGEKKGRSNLRREAMARVVLGISSLEEVKRVVG